MGEHQLSIVELEEIVAGKVMQMHHFHEPTYQHKANSSSSSFTDSYSSNEDENEVLKHHIVHMMGERF